MAQGEWPRSSLKKGGKHLTDGRVWFLHSSAGSLKAARLDVVFCHFIVIEMDDMNFKNRETNVV